MKTSRITHQTYHRFLLSKLANKPVKKLDSVMVPADLVYIQDRVAPYLFETCKDILKDLNTPMQLYLDHEGPASNLEVANKFKYLKKMGETLGISVFEEGTGVSHQVVCEKFAMPGQVICSPDSHVSQVGALGALGIEVGARESAIIARNGCVLVTVPPSITVHLSGQFRQGVTAFDLMMYLSLEFGKLLNDSVIEFVGPALKNISMSSRFTLANLSTDIGALHGIVAPDEVTIEWLASKRKGHLDGFISTNPIVDMRDALRLDLADIPAMCLTENGPIPIKELPAIRIDRISVGSCTHGSIDDIEAFSQQFEDIAPNLLVTLTPGSRDTLLKLTENLTAKKIVERGVLLTSPGCGSCMGLGHGVVADGEIVVTTHNNAKRGRMGSRNAQIYVVNPIIAGKCAEMGTLSAELERR